jgi:hypothetical protein
MVIASATIVNGQGVSGLLELTDNAVNEHGAISPDYGPAMLRYVVTKGNEIVTSDRGWETAHKAFLSLCSPGVEIDYRDRILLTHDDMRGALDEITFANSELDFKWRFDFEPATVSDIACWALHASFERPDTDTGKLGWGRGRDLIVKPGATESAVFFTCYLLVRILIDHELMEGINYRGRRVLYPHTPVTSMIGLQDRIHKERRERLN